MRTGTEIVNPCIRATLNITKKILKSTGDTNSMALNRIMN